MKRRLPILFLLAALAVGCTPTMVMAPAPAPVPEGPVQDPAVPIHEPVQEPAPGPEPAPTTAPELELGDLIPIDPAILTGRLDNGLTYFVRQNAEPPDRVELRLVVNAGSVLEDPSRLSVHHRPSFRFPTAVLQLF